MDKELLTEIGTEEIPASFCPNTLIQMEQSMGERLSFLRIPHGEIKALCTPRRLTLCVKGVAEMQQDQVIKAVGPPKSVAFDKEGKPTKAATGFAKNQGVPVEDLRIEEIPGKGAYISVEKKDKGRETAQLLPELIPAWITSLGFPKFMRWGSGDLRFARPIHWIMALFGGVKVPFSLDGIASCAETYGHRFLHPGPIRVEDFSSYLRLLEEEGYVICDQERRMAMISELAKKEAERAGGALREDGALLEEVTHLVEWPVALCGSFEPAYLDLPEEVLVTSMRDHQKYFCIVGRDGRLMPRFITISNIPAKNPQVIIGGNERVIRARLSDAAFFLKEDTKTPFSDSIDALKDVVFQEQLGSIHQKALRIRGLALFLADEIREPALETTQRTELKSDLERAALLCKCDLVTEMVKEFPELQGVMGREYALKSGESAMVARAVYEHYLPRFAGDELPQTLAGALLSLSDKMDNLAGCFSIGLIPTGSEDPHALRRQVHGIIQICVDKCLVFPWQGFVRTGLSSLSAGTGEVEEKIRQFLQQRLNNFFLNQGYDYDLINAVLDAGEDANPIYAKKRLDALSTFRSEEAFNSILTPFKRVINILPKGEKGAAKAIDRNLFREDAERALYQRFKELETELNNLISGDRYLEALEAMVALREPIDLFFDQVLVMDKDEGIKGNRLALLSSIGQVFLKVADFSRIVQEQTSQEAIKDQDS